MEHPSPPPRSPRQQQQQPPPPPDVDTPPLPPLLAYANAHASSAFRRTVRSVLRHSSLACLRRAMSSRVREYMRRLPPERLLSSSSSGELPYNNELDPSILEVTMADVESCHRFAKRVGTRWAEALRAGGYVELSEVAHSVANEGRFLGCDLSSSTSSTTTSGGGHSSTSRGGGRGRSTTIGSTHAALRALRRYPPDCDGSGLPSERLVTMYDHRIEDVRRRCDGTSSTSCDRHPDRRRLSAPTPTPPPPTRRRVNSSASAAISRIDDMVRNGMTYWEYGWDAIEEAVSRNRERIDYSRVGYDVDDDEILDGGERRDDAVVVVGRKRGRSRGRRGAVRFADDDDRVDDDDGDADVGVSCTDFSSTSANEHSASVFKRRKGVGGYRSLTSEGGVTPLGDGNVDDVSKNDEADGCNGTDGRGVAFGDVEGGRPPSSIGQETFRWHDVLEEMTTEERRGLILSAIHPPYPFESDSEGGTTQRDCEPDDAHLDAVVCGALKEVGETHLWEQTRHYHPSGDVDEGTSKVGEEHAVPDGYDAEGRMAGELYGASEARASFRSQERSRRRKRAMTRATKERLGRRIVSIKEHSASYAKAVACSKVRWTEDDFAHLRRENTESGPSCADSTLPPRGERSERPRRWLEMDLGECTIEMVDGDERTKPGKVGGGENCERSKRFLTFRSLEVALMN